MDIYLDYECAFENAYECMLEEIEDETVRENTEFTDDQVNEYMEKNCYRYYD